MTRRHAPRVAALAIALTIAALIASAARAGGQRRPSPASVPLVNADGSVTCRGALDVTPCAAVDGISYRGTTHSVAPGDRENRGALTPELTGLEHVGGGQLGVRAALAGGASADERPWAADVTPGRAADDRTDHGPPGAVSTGNLRLTDAASNGFPHGNDIRGRESRGGVAFSSERGRGASLGDHVTGVIRIGPKPEMRRVTARPVIARVADVQPVGPSSIGHNERKPMGEPGPTIDAHAPIAVTLAHVPAPLPAVAVGAESGRLIDPLPELRPQSIKGSGIDRDIIWSHREPPTLGAAGRDVSASPAIRMSIDTHNYTTRPVENVLASVTLRSVSGATLCRAAPMFDGIVTARHCIDNGAVHIDDGTSPPHSVDPTRDLAHIKALANPAVVMRPAVVGERLRWRSDFGAGDVTVRWTRGAVVAFAHGSGTRLSWGCSGTGLYGDDGALVAVLSDLYHDGDDGRVGRLVGGGEAVQVP